VALADFDELTRTFRWRVPERINMGVASVDVHPADDVALIVDDGGVVTRWTFGELRERSDRLAGALRRAGVGRGDRVAVVAGQRVETALTHLAAWKLGAVSLPLSSLFGPDALRYRLADSRTTLAVVSTENRPKVQEAAPGLPLVEIGPQFEALCSGDPLDGAADTGPADPAYLIYTSGTTGEPKGALLGHGSLIGHLSGYELYYQFIEGAPMGRHELSVYSRTGDDPVRHDLMWSPADWAWIAGLMDVLIPSWYFGLPVLISTADFEPHRAAELMASHGVTLAFLPPTALKMMRAAGVTRTDLSLRAIFSGGEALGAPMLDWARANLGCGINEGYGQTEANVTVGNCAALFPIRPGSMGRPMPGHHLAVLDDDATPVVGVEGEIAVRSPDPVMMLGYWNRPDATAARFRGDWFLTGDLGRQDEDGYLWFSSRADDVINSMGYRIGPGEIETSLMGHPAVALCAVVGEPDELRGQVPVAHVVLRPGHDPGPDLAAELQHHVRTRLAAHEVPRRVVFADDLPRTATGKIMRRALRTT
jgi:acetyl-CoA synthetase